MRPFQALFIGEQLSVPLVQSVNRLYPLLSPYQPIGHQMAPNRLLSKFLHKGSHIRPIQALFIGGQNADLKKRANSLMKWCLHLLMCILKFYQRNDMGPWSLFSPWWELSKNALGDDFRYMIRSLWPLECHTAFCMYYLGVLCSRDDPPTCWGGPRDLMEGFQGSDANPRLVADSVVWHRPFAATCLWGADNFNLKVWEGACPRYKCITPLLVQNLCHQYRMWQAEG